MVGAILILGGIGVISTAVGVVVAKALTPKLPDYTEGWLKEQVWDP
jgi:hypothetical protein